MISLGSTNEISYIIDGIKHTISIQPNSPNQEDIDAMKVYMETGCVPLAWHEKKTSGTFSNATPVEEIIRKSMEVISE